MLKLAELDSWAKDLWNIIIDLHIGYSNSLRLTENNYPHEDKIKQHGFYKHYWYMLRFVMIIQFAKLLDDNSNQKRNLNKLIRRLSSEKYDIAFHDKLKLNLNSEGNTFCSRQDILEKVVILKAELREREELVNRVVLARNKLYAHKDDAQSLVGISLDELKNLLNLCDRFYNEIFGKIFDYQALFNHTKPWSVDSLLREASENMENLRKSLE